MISNVLTSQGFNALQWVVKPCSTVLKVMGVVGLSFLLAGKVGANSILKNSILKNSFTAQLTSLPCSPDSVAQEIAFLPKPLPPSFYSKLTCSLPIPAVFLAPPAHLSRRMRVGPHIDDLDPKKIQNNQRAIDSAFKAIVKNNFFRGTEEEFVTRFLNTLKDVHDQLEITEPMTSRGFRDQLMLAPHSHVIAPEEMTRLNFFIREEDRGQYERAMIARWSPVEEREVNLAHYDDMVRRESPCTILSSAMRKVYQYIGKMFPRPAFISPLLNHAARELYHNYHEMRGQKEGVNYLRLANLAFGHLNRVQPFARGTGRIARLVMNMLLMRGGHRPVVFPNREAYANAIIEDDVNPGAFLRYVIELIERA
jgi:hypothetical protein